MIPRQFLGLGIPPPPSSVAMKILHSSSVHRGDSGGSGEDRGKNRDRLTGIEETMHSLQGSLNNRWEAASLKKWYCLLRSGANEEKQDWLSQRKSRSGRKRMPPPSYKIGDGERVPEPFGCRSQKQR